MYINLSRFVLFLFLTCSGLFMVLPSWAQPQATAVVPATCDPDFWEIMDARAWMEGSREMEVAQRLILKPDSVLEYSCFTTRANQLSGGTVFSSGGNIGTLVGSALNGYLTNHFSHSFGGGTAGGGSGCNSMQVVWDALRCSNFEEGMFYTFSDLASLDPVIDPRNAPVQCPAGNRTSLWNAALTAAYPTPAIPAANGGLPIIYNYSRFIYEISCNDIPPIPTGVMYRNRAGELKPDAVCPAIGCYFDGGTKCRDVP